MSKRNKLKGSIIGGAIGDAWGSAFEHDQSAKPANTYVLGGQKPTEPDWMLTDDTQLTTVTLEALVQHPHLTPELLAANFVTCFRKRRITGIGASTLKAFQELEAGGHWSQVGRSGEFAAGNGAAMRITPFAFWNKYSREDIRDFVRITHRNDEAYVGALAVIFAIRLALAETPTDLSILLEHVAKQLPDVAVRDRLLYLAALPNSATIADYAKFGTSGYVVDSVPFAIAAATKVGELGFEVLLKNVILAGGDTDTNASIAGQIAGAVIGFDKIPEAIVQKLTELPDGLWVFETVERASVLLEDCA
jgi:ADP-ribosylglycohydrolase